jgi:hypothetical protein
MNLQLNSFLVEDKTKIICSGTLCCYQKDKEHMICASSDNWKNIVFIIKIIEK